MKKRARMFINGHHIYLKEIRLPDVNKSYCDWLNDPQVNQYLECRYQRWTIRKLKVYVKGIKADKNNLFFAIFLRGCGKHIGNIKLGPVNCKHGYGEIGIIIGDKMSWGKGIATEAIKLVKNYAFNKLKIHKLTAGAYSKNIGSIKAFQKAGFYIEGVLKKQCSCKGKYVDCTLLGCVRG